jgi:hypothetical protein
MSGRRILRAAQRALLGAMMTVAAAVAERASGGRSAGPPPLSLPPVLHQNEKDNRSRRDSQGK